MSDAAIQRDLARIVRKQRQRFGDSGFLLYIAAVRQDGGQVIAVSDIEPETHRKANEAIIGTDGMEGGR